MSVVSADGTRIAVFEAGDPAAATVVLVHGYPDTHAVWDDVVARLADRYHVVAYDVRGAGASAHPRQAAAYDLDRLVDDFLAVADAVSPDRPVHLVGHDWGSVQGWEIATVARTRGRVASFTSLSGPCLDHVAHWLRTGNRSIGAMLRQGAKSWYVYVFMVPGLAPWAARLVVGRRFGNLLERREAVPPRPGHAAATLAEDAACGTLLYRRNFPRRLRHPRPDAVAQVPVQVIVAARDRYVSPDLFTGLDRWVPDLRCHTLDAPHWAPITHADDVARLVAELVG